MRNIKNILIIGYGNSSRQDDGIAPELINRLEKCINKQEIENIDLLSNTQLDIEDAYIISVKDIVFFVDATEENIDDFLITRVEAEDSGPGYSLHTVSPGFILQLCQTLYKKIPEAYLVHIKGYKWGIKDELSKKALKNIDKTLEVLIKIINDPERVKNYLS